jgi:hypothetical protein
MSEESLQPAVDETEIKQRSFHDVAQGVEAIGLGLGTAGIAVAKLKETFGGNSSESTPPPSETPAPPKKPE